MPTHLTSADNPRIKAATKLLRQGRERRKQGLFIAEGLRQVGRAIEAGIGVEQLFWLPDLLGDKVGDVEAWCAATGAAGFTVTETLLKKITYSENPQGVVAVCVTPRYELEAVLANADLVLVAVGLEKPGNLGAIARSVDAAGADALIVADGVVDAFHPNSLTASTGAVLTLPVVSAEGAAVREALNGWNVIVTSPDAKAMCYDTDMAGRCAIVIGPEDQGLDDAWLASGTATAIPMAGRTVDSLNASTAAAVLLFEAVRQRRCVS